LTNNPIGSVIASILIVIMVLAGLFGFFFGFIWFFSRWIIAEVPLAVEEDINVAVKEKITLLAKFLGEKMNYFKRNLSNMRANVVRLEKILGTIDRSEQAKSKYLKPQNWFIDLMYSDKGMPIGLTGIGKAIEDLIHSHRKMATTSVNKYTKWLLANYKQAQSDSKAFGTLKISPSEFILQGSSEFNRSIGLKRPLGDNVFYRGKELPGNKAFYTQVRPKDKIGISSIGTIADVGFGIYDYDPQSYRLNRLNLYNISKISTISWVASMVLTFPLIGVTVGASVASLGPALYAIYKSSAIAETGNNVRIDKSMVFETLTIDQIKNVLNEVNKGIKELHNWHNDVFENNWKKPELDSIINNITGLDRIEVNNNSSFRALKRYCMALLNLMNSTTIGVHAYAFKTYGAMINYADKSLKQYKPKE